MNLEEEFDKRIAAIHRLGNQSASAWKQGANTMDIRHEEFQAMADVFLGAGFDQAKLKQVEDLQTALHKGQAELYKKYGTGEVSPERYVEVVNTLIDDTFKECEKILGPEDFLKLFGAPRSEIAGFIDKETFLQAHRTRQNRPF